MKIVGHGSVINGKVYLVEMTETELLAAAGFGSGWDARDYLPDYKENYPNHCFPVGAQITAAHMLHLLTSLRDKEEAVRKADLKLHMLADALHQALRTIERGDVEA